MTIESGGSTAPGGRSLRAFPLPGAPAPSGEDPTAVRHAVPAALPSNPPSDGPSPPVPGTRRRAFAIVRSTRRPDFLNPGNHGGLVARIDPLEREALQVVDIFDGSANIGVIPWSNVVNAKRAEWPAKYAPEINNHRRYPPVLPLSDDSQAVRTAINSLAAVGVSTMSALGIAGGVHHLQAGTSDMQAIVLLTDGVDNQCPDHWPRTCSYFQIRDNRADECARAKEAGIRIFVVAAMAPRRVSSDLAGQLCACSSEADDPDGTYTFLNNADAESLEAAFINIAGQLQPMRKVY